MQATDTPMRATACSPPQPGLLWRQQMTLALAVLGPDQVKMMASVEVAFLIHLHCLTVMPADCTLSTLRKHLLPSSQICEKVSCQMWESVRLPATLSLVSLLSHECVAQSTCAGLLIADGVLLHCVCRVLESKPGRLRPILPGLGQQQLGPLPDSP